MNSAQIFVGGIGVLAAMWAGVIAVGHHLNRTDEQPTPSHHVPASDPVRSLR